MLILKEQLQVAALEEQDSMRVQPRVRLRPLRYFAKGPTTPDFGAPKMSHFFGTTKKNQMANSKPRSLLKVKKIDEKKVRCGGQKSEKVNELVGFECFFGDYWLSRKQVNLHKPLGVTDYW